MRTILLYPIILAGAIAPAFADTSLQQTATRQEQIRGEAKLLLNRLDQVLDEYDRNGIARGDDYQSLKGIRAALGTLSDQEMEQVVALLRQSTGSSQDMAKAYSTQKDISVRLKRILAEHQRQHDIDALGRAVGQLAERQSANLSVGIDARQLGAQDHSPNGQAALTASRQAQQSEQSAIAAEIKLLAAQLDQAAAEPKQKDAAADLEQAQPEAAAASDALASARLDDAVDAEKSTREKLQAVAAALLPASEPSAPQDKQAGQLADLLRQQRALLDQTMHLSAALQKTVAAETPEAADKEMYGQIKLPTYVLSQKLAELGITPASPADQIRDAPPMKGFLDARAARLKQDEQTLHSQLAALPATQAALAAKAQMVREDLRSTAKDAAVPMANAVTQMNSAQEALAESDGDQATQDQTDAVTQLAQAERAVEQSAAAQKSPAPSSADKDQQTRDLMGGVHQLAYREQQSVQQNDAAKTGPMADAAAAQQQNLADKAEALAQAATQQGQPAAQPLQQAAGAFHNAGQAIQSGLNAAAAKAQQDALQALAQAAQQLNQQAATSASEKKELAAMEHQMEGLDHVIKEQQQVGAETAAAGASAPLRQGKARALAARQNTVRRETQAIRHAMDTAAPDAAKPLDHADNAMGEAAQKLSDQSGADAQPSQKEALASLYAAQDAMSAKMQQLAQAAGVPAARAPRDAGGELAKAAAQLSAAQSAMANASAAGSMNGAASQLAQAAQSASRATDQPQALSPAAREAARAAQQALAGAEAAARDGDQSQAQSEAGQAAQAIAAAQSALGAAESGIAGLSPQDQGKGSQPQPAPKGQGKDGAKEQLWKDQAGAVAAAGSHEHSAGEYIGLPERERAALQQSQSEKYPQEYGTMIEEYMRSLASDSGSK